MYIQNSSHHGPWGSDGATIGKTIFTYVYIETKFVFSRTSMPISIKLSTNHPWVKGILNCSIKGQVFFKGEIITKMQKWGGVI
jgi:hypothetical protein